MAEPRRRSAAGLSCEAMLWHRFDFRESSRIVVLLTREHGRIQALAKGSHRADSPMLGRLDFLNDLNVRLSADRGGLRLLLRADLLRERRGLRQALRYLAASHLVELGNYGFPDGLPDPELFDLIHGGLTLLERCPLFAVAQVMIGLELRFLIHLGCLPDIEHCTDCGTPLTGGAFLGSDGGLACRSHAPSPKKALPERAFDQLRRLSLAKGRDLPELDLVPLSPTAVALPMQWLSRALERRGRLRRYVFDSALAQHRVDSTAGRPLP
jgi:DNA repair protein RecO (recombination protein O)